MSTLAWVLYRVGLRRLKHGFCPGCHSSPPRPECPLCEGEHHYAPFDPEKVALLRQRWTALCEVIR